MTARMEMQTVLNKLKNPLYISFIVVFLIVQYLFVGDILRHSESVSPLVYELNAAIIGSIITVLSGAVILKHQSEQEKNKDFSSRIFERKLSIYEDLLTLIFSIDDDKIIKDSEIHALENQIGLASLVASKRLVSILAQYMYQMKIYGVMYFRSLNDEQLQDFLELIIEEKKKKNTDESVLCDQKFQQDILPTNGQEIEYFLSLDEVIQALREDLALIDGDIKRNIEHFVRTPIDAKKIQTKPNLVDA